MTNIKYEKITSDDFSDGVFKIGNSLIIDENYYYIRINEEEQKKIKEAGDGDFIIFDYLNNAYVIIDAVYNNLFNCNDKLYNKYHENIIKEIESIKNYHCGDAA